MTRLNLNINGATPLADTASGAAGDVTGTERKKVQDILDAAKQMATGALDGLMSAAHYALLAGATALNAANTLVKRDGAGNFAAGTITATLAGSASSCSGNAATASALSAGADRNKLDGIAAGATNNPMTIQDVILVNIAMTQNTWNAVGQMALGAGTWLLLAQVSVKDASSGSNDGFALRLRGSVSGTVGAGEASCGTSGTVAQIGVATIVAGGQTIFVECYPNLTAGNAPQVEQNSVLTGERVSYLKAVRIA